MLLRLFRSTGAQILVLIPLMGFLLWLPSIISPPKTQFLFDAYPMPTYKLVREIIPVESLFGSVLTFGLILFQSLLLVRLNTRFIFINNRTYLPALFFVLITAAIPELQRLNPVIFSGFFLLLAVEQLFNAYRHEKVAYEIFSASFLISLGATFYPFLIFFLFIVWASLVILRPFIWREWVFSIIGFFLPWFFVFSYYYLIHGDPHKIFTDYALIFGSGYKFKYYSGLTYGFVSFLVFLILLASQFIIKEYTGKKILPRKAFLLFLWLFVNTILVYLLVEQTSAELIFLGAIPVSYLLSNYFNFMRSHRWGDIFLFTLIFFVVLIQFHHWR
jgi:hypothetical protein